MALSNFTQSFREFGFASVAQMKFNMRQLYWVQTLHSCHWDDRDPPTRTVRETILRTFGLHFVAAAAFGHLLSLQNRINARRKAAALEVIVFVLLPTLPLAHLLRDVYQLVRRRPSRADIHRYVALALGAQLPETGEGGWNDSGRLVVRKTKPYDFLWIGRSILLLALLAQFSGTVFLSYRRAQSPAALHRKMFDETEDITGSADCGEKSLWPWNTSLPVDNRNLEMALAGMVIVLRSLVIHLVNAVWSMPEPNLQSEEHGLAIAVLETQNPVLGPIVPMTVVTRPEHSSGIEIASCSPNGKGNSMTPHTLDERPTSSRAQLCSRLMTLVKKNWTQIEYCYTALRVLNANMSSLTRRVYSQQRQHDFELAYVLRVLYLLLFPLDAGVANTNAFVDPYRYLAPSWIVRRLDVTFKQTFISPQEGVIKTWQPGYYQGAFATRRNPVTTSLFVVSYLLPCIVLLTFFIFGTCARIIRRLGFSVPFTRFWSEINFWLRQEITICYLLLFLGMGFHIVVDVRFHIVRTMIIAMAEKDGIEQGYRVADFWKDSLTDQLYII